MSERKKKSLERSFEDKGLGDKVLMFKLPPIYGPESYLSLERRIRQSGSQTPTTRELADIIYDAFKNPYRRHSQRIFQIMNSYWFLSFQGIYNIFGKIYVEDHPKKIDKTAKLLLKEPTSRKYKRLERLEKKLENDPNVRIVKGRFDMGIQSPSRLRKNPLVLALAGTEGARTLSRVAEENNMYASIDFNTIYKGFFASVPCVYLKRVRKNGATRDLIVISSLTNLLGKVNYAFSIPSTSPYWE